MAIHLRSSAFPLYIISVALLLQANVPRKYPNNRQPAGQPETFLISSRQVHRLDETWHSLTLNKYLIYNVFVAQESISGLLESFVGDL